MTAVREIMMTDVLEMEMASTLQEAAQSMRERSVSSLLVTEHGRLVGIMTERDHVHAVSDGVDASVAHVRDYMTANPVSTLPDASVEDATKVMLEHGFRHLPVIDDDHKLLGVISMRDLARAGIQVPVDLKD